MKNWLGWVYRYLFKNLNDTDLGFHNGFIMRDGVCNSNSAVYRWWTNGTDYYDRIFTEMVYRRWLQIKQAKKFYNNYVAPKRGDDSDEICYKYDYMLKVTVHNIDQLSHQAKLDISGYETIWDTVSLEKNERCEFAYEEGNLVWVRMDKLWLF